MTEEMTRWCHVWCAECFMKRPSSPNCCWWFRCCKNCQTPKLSRWNPKIYHPSPVKTIWTMKNALIPFHYIGWLVHMCTYYVVNEVILPIKPDWLIIPVVIKQPSGISLPLSIHLNLNLNINKYVYIYVNPYTVWWVQLQSKWWDSIIIQSPISKSGLPYGNWTVCQGNRPDELPVEQCDFP